MGEQTRILVTVKTYPLPSKSYLELVCTAGVREDGGWVRLYPIDYRYRPYWQWYGKYQWIEAEIEKNRDDPRPESFRPVPGTAIKALGRPIPPKRNWAERRKYVLAGGVQTMCGLARRDQKERSLGIVRPARVKDLKIEPAERDWKPEWKAQFAQGQLFGPQRKPLEKIPYKFSYVFECEEPGCTGHTMMIEDWEIGELYRKMRTKHGTEEAAVEKVKHRFLDTICAPEIDIHFYVGTVLAHNTWIVLGTFWPKKGGAVPTP